MLMFYQVSRKFLAMRNITLYSVCVRKIVQASSLFQSRLITTSQCVHNFLRIFDFVFLSIITCFYRILNLRFIFTKIFLFYLFFKWLQIAFFQIKSYTSIIVSVLISIENFYLVEKQNKGNLICRFRIRENMR